MSTGTGDPQPESDDGLRRLLTWTLVALVAAVLLAAAATTLVMYWFDAPS